MAESVNIFTNGMNSDNSPLYQPEHSYVEGLNVELLSDKQQGSVALSNAKGNKFQIAIPNVGKIYKLNIYPLFTVASTFITINGITSATAFQIISTTTYKELYDFIENDPNFNLTNITLYYDDTKLIIVSAPPNTLTVTVSNNAILLGGDVSGGGTGPYIPAQTNLQPIGYGVINDDIYIFTTNCVAINPQSTGGGYGQIWKLYYDNIDFDAANATLDLIYSADLAFTTYYHIPQTGVVPRYENISTQRLYWTDNYNKVRSLNVANPDAFLLEPTLLEMVPAVDFDIPILTQITPGGPALFPAGSYQLAYRLKNTTNSSSTFSPLSDIVYLTSSDERLALVSGSDNFTSYYGNAPGTLVSKILSWTINNIDTNYDRIEAVLLIRDTYGGIPTIYSFLDDAISGRETITITVDGSIITDTNVTELTLPEFLVLSGYFTHCKTLATKDNRLIAGNIRMSSGEIDFDPRAYRYESTGNYFTILNNGVLDTYTNNYSDIPEDADAINPSYLSITDPNYIGGFLYNTSGNLGGEGPNISYEFISVAVESDTGNGGNTSTSLMVGASQISPFRSTAHDVLPLSLNLDLSTYSYNTLQQYPLALPQITYEDMKYPQYNSIYWGYQQEEVYRFGIQFYDKAKNPYFVKWIGDIEFPSINDPVASGNSIYVDGTPTNQTTFVKSFIAIRTGKNRAAYITQLGIKFNITIPAALTEKISGYSIVRVKRGEADKTIITEGLIASSGDAITSGSDIIYYSPDANLSSGFLNVYTGYNEDRVCFFSTPNLLVPGVATPQAGDTLCVRKLFGPDTFANSTDLGNSSADPYYIYKFYNEIAYTTTNIPITQAITIDVGSTNTALNGNAIQNRDNAQVSIGDRCLFFTVTNNIPGINSGSGKLFAIVKRALGKQYGGNSYAERSGNVYMMCSHFRAIKTSASDIIDSPKIFGGDTMNYHIDMQRCIKDWAGTGSTKISSTFIYPAGSCANIGFRYGTFVNKDLVADNALQASGTETYDYNRAYSCENDIVEFYPKPDPFSPQTEFVNRFIASEIKINGELSDSWSVFKENNYWDVEGTYGAINSSLIMSDKFYFWQDRAFGVMQINPRALVQDINATSLQVGTGLPLQRHDYISTVIGTKHQSSTISSDKKLYWYDTNTNKVYTFDSSGGLTPFSDVKGLYAYFRNNLDGQIQNVDKPLYFDNSIGINGIAATYDYVRHRAILTFHSGKNVDRKVVQKSFTVSINEFNDTFLSFYSFKPKMYINDFKHIFSTDNISTANLKNIYIHNQGDYAKYYDILYTSYIKFIVNPDPKNTKVFDNLVFDAQSKNGTINIHDDFWNKIRITDDYQNTDVISIIYPNNIKRRERSWQMAIPRNRVLYTSSNSPDIYTDLSPTAKPFGERIRDKYMSVELIYDNQSNYQLLTNNIRSIYRPSAR